MCSRPGAWRCGGAQCSGQACLGLHLVHGQLGGADKRSLIVHEPLISSSPLPSRMCVSHMVGTAHFPTAGSSRPQAQLMATDFSHQVVAWWEGSLHPQVSL